MSFIKLAEEQARLEKANEPPSASQINSQLFKIIDFLKSQEKSVSYLDIKANTGVDLSTNGDLMEIIKKTKVIEFTDGMLLYKPAYDIKSKEDLLNLVESHCKEGAGGLHVRDIKDAYKGLPKAIDDLSKANQILVIKHKEKPAVLFYNQLSHVGLGVGEEFKELWLSVSVPNEADVERELSTAGLKLLEVQRDAQKPAEDKLKGKKKRTRNIKPMNTHLKNIDLSVEYGKSKGK